MKILIGHPSQRWTQQRTCSGDRGGRVKVTEGHMPQDNFPYKDLIYTLPSASKHTEKNTKVICGRHRIEVIHTIKKTEQQKLNK